MFIECRLLRDAPSDRRAMSVTKCVYEYRTADMALLTEGGRVPLTSINLALLTED